MAVAAAVPAERAPGVALLSAAYPAASVSRLPASSETAPRVLPYSARCRSRAARKAGRSAMLCSCVRYASHSAAICWFGQDVLQQRIAVRYTALLHIGEFQQLGIEQPLQFLVQDRRHPPRYPMQPLGGAVRSGLCQEIRGAVHERHGQTPH